jgi:hypothetical protein
MSNQFTRNDKVLFTVKSLGNKELTGTVLSYNKEFDEYEVCDQINCVWQVADCHMKYAPLSAKEFADAVVILLGRTYHIDLNKRDGESRLRTLVGRIEHLNRYDPSTRFFALDNAAYGLNRAIVTGRTNSYANLAVKSMNVRQMCELIYELAEYSQNIEDYAGYLNRKHTTKG